MTIELNHMKYRVLPISESVQKGLEPEAKIKDFDVIKEIGTGSYGTVYLVRHKITKAEYAIKAVNKMNLYKEKPYFREVEEKFS